jgi:lipid II:glycine glycyltransferase (peptidoglycan interpeptide bridge formation enzyme)
MQRLFEPNHNFQLLFAEVAGEPVSVLLLIPFGDTVLAKRNGWSGKHRELKPNDLIYWAGIQWSRQNGYHYFDLEGVDRTGAMTILAGKPLPDHLRECYDQLKYRYGGQVVLYPEAYDLIRLNPILYFLYTHLRFEVGTSAFISKILDLLRNR